MTTREFETEAEAVLEQAMDSISWYLTEYEEEISLDEMASIFSKVFKKELKQLTKDLKERGVE